MEIFCHLNVSPPDAEQNTSGIDDSSGSVLPIEFEDSQIRLATRETTIVTGPNGVGKSALLAEIARSCGEGDVVETFFGSRRINFDSDNIEHMEQPIERLGQQLRQSANRYRQPYGDQQFKSVLKRVVNKHAQSGDDIIAALDLGATLAAAKEDNPRVLDSINSVFRAALLPIEFILAEGTLKAKRGQSEYGVDRLSDGERAALLVAGAVLVRPQNTFIVIDEPERHLNPAISGPLLSALTRVRPDLGYIFATHDLNLIEWLIPQKIIHVRNSIVVDQHSEKRLFSISVLTSENDLPEELRYAILGTRHKLLLVEGTALSEDKALYSLLYPDWNVVARGGWETVSTGVRALSKSSEFHWLVAAGFIDGDGHSESEKQALAGESIYCLPSPTIENLFFHPTVIKCMAEASYRLSGGDTVVERLAAIEALLSQLLGDNRSNIVARQLVWEGNRLLSSKKISVQSVIDGQSAIEAVDLQPLRQQIEARFDTALVGNSLIDALQKLPIKNTNIPVRTSQAVGFKTFPEYKRSVLKQLESESELGIEMKAALLNVVPELLSEN